MPVPTAAMPAPRATAVRVGMAMPHLAPVEAAGVEAIRALRVRAAPAAPRVRAPVVATAGSAAAAVQQSQVLRATVATGARGTGRPHPARRVPPVVQAAPVAPWATAETGARVVPAARRATVALAALAVRAGRYQATAATVAPVVRPVRQPPQAMAAKGAPVLPAVRPGRQATAATVAQAVPAAQELSVRTLSYSVDRAPREPRAVKVVLVASVGPGVWSRVTGAMVEPGVPAATVEPAETAWSAPPVPRVVPVGLPDPVVAVVPVEQRERSVE